MKKLFLAGHRGMVGQAISRAVSLTNEYDLITATRDELDLTDAKATCEFLKKTQPDCVLVAAAKVGGIFANSNYPAEFIRDNLAIALNTIHESWKHGIQRLLFLGSSCIYPKHAPQPITEDALLSSPLEPSNEPYAIAKIAGLKLCQAYRNQYGILFHSAMPTNLYGPGDNYHPDHSHVLPALIRRFHEAKVSGAEAVTIWGTGSPRREFLHVDDLARACLLLLNCSDPPDWVNLGTGEDIPIIDLAHLVAKIVGYNGSILTDPSKPDGTPLKRLDVSRLAAMGWTATITLEDGIRTTYQDFLEGDQSGTLRCV